MDDFLEEDEEQEEDRQVTVKRSDLKTLQRTARDGKKALDRLAALERKDAFREAGIPVGDKRADYFIKGYDGEVKPEAIKAEWDELYGPSEQQSTDPAEAAAHQRVSEASTGAEPPKTSITVEDLAQASSPEEVMRMVDELGMRFDRQ